MRRDNTPGRRLRIGVIGCGEVSQIIHLPTLAQLADRFEVTALCDISPMVVRDVGDAWGVAGRCATPDALLERDDVDAVLIASPDAYHAETALAAVARGKDVLVEKPMCLTLRECDELIAAADATGAVVQVGYMRRHAPALAEAKRALVDLGPIRFARVHDVIGHNSLIIEQTSRVVRGADVSDAALAGSADRRSMLLREALGEVSPTLTRAYGLLLGLGSHDISAMRELLGLPRGVEHATVRQGGDYVTATIDYGDFVCHYETGVDEIPRLDAHIEVYGSKQVLRVQYDTPYVRNLPIRLTVTEANGSGGVTERCMLPEWGDPFVAEWLAFADAVRDRSAPMSSPADFRYDLELFGQMIGL